MFKVFYKHGINVKTEIYWLVDGHSIKKFKRFVYHGAKETLNTKMNGEKII